jgi:hypothetical protein
MRQEQPLEQLYDDVLIPTLALAADDHRRGALDDERLEFVCQEMRELVEELGDQEQPRLEREVAARTELAAKDQPQDRDSKYPSVPKDCIVNVLLLPARGPADEIVAIMLQQSLELRGYCPLVATAHSLASEMVEMIHSKQADLVAVSAMPPAAVAHARYLCKRIHQRFPDIPMVVGLWRARGDLRKASSRIACGQQVPVVTSLAQIQHEIDQLAQPVIVRGPNPPDGARAQS